MRKFGAKITPIKLRDYDYFACCSSTPEEELPEKFMLPIDEWAIVKDQNGYNACVSFALTTAQEANYCKQTGKRKTWSPGYIYGNPLCRPNYNGEGMYTHDALKGTMKSGYVEEIYFDVLAEMPKMLSYVKDRKDLVDMGETTRLKGFTNLNYALFSKKISAMKQALYTYKTPLIIASDRFFGGAHCVVVYGWDDTFEMRGYGKDDIMFAFRNSWGVDYKNGGNWFIPTSKIDEVYMPIYQDLEMTFNDIKKSDWYYDDVRAAVFSGLVRGVNKLEFCPDSQLSRGDAAIIIARLMHKLRNSFSVFAKTEQQKGNSVQPFTFKPKENCTFIFDDVHRSDYYYDSIREVCANGYMNGVGDKKFEPESPISRAELATLVVRLLEGVTSLIESGSKVKLTLPRHTIINFMDISDSDWFFNSVNRAVELGLVTGYDNSIFRPYTSISRAESTVIFNRLFKIIDTELEFIRDKYTDKN